MSATIINFPNGRRAPTFKRVEIDTRNYGTIRGRLVKKPKTAQQFLDLCKDHLNVDDYMDVLCSIMDSEHYDAMDDHIQELANIYRTFKS
jgi:hypothetical protein